MSIQEIRDLLANSKERYFDESGREVEIDKLDFDSLSDLLPKLEKEGELFSLRFLRPDLG